MKYLSATDVAIARAHKAGELRVVLRNGRFGNYYSIEDEEDVIEVQLTRAELIWRLRSITGETRFEMEK